MKKMKICKFSANNAIRKFMHKNKKTKRNKAIYADKLKGMSHKDMALKHNVSVGRIYPILKIYFYKKRGV